MYGIRKAPPPLSYAMKGKRHTFPNPTDVAMHDNRNSRLLDQIGRRWAPFVLRSASASASITTACSVGFRISENDAIITQETRVKRVMGSRTIRDVTDTKTPSSAQPSSSAKNCQTSDGAVSPGSKPSTCEQHSDIAEYTNSIYINYYMPINIITLARIVNVRAICTQANGIRLRSYHSDNLLPFPFALRP